MIFWLPEGISAHCDAPACQFMQSLRLPLADSAHPRKWMQSHGWLCGRHPDAAVVVDICPQCRPDLEQSCGLMPLYDTPDKSTIPSRVPQGDSAYRTDGTREEVAL